MSEPRRMRVHRPLLAFLHLIYTNSYRTPITSFYYCISIVNQSNQSIPSSSSSLFSLQEEDIMADMCRDHKSSRHANEETSQRYNQANCRVVSKHLVDITPWMEGSVILSYLYEKDGARPYVLA